MLINPYIVRPPEPAAYAAKPVRCTHSNLCFPKHRPPTVQAHQDRSAGRLLMHPAMDAHKMLFEYLKIELTSRFAEQTRFSDH